MTVVSKETEAYDPQTLLFVREWRKCAPDWDESTIEEKLDAFEYWCGKYVYIKHPKGRRLFKLRDSQRETVRAWLTHRHNIALKARQVGFSTVVAIFCLWITYFYEDRAVIMLSKAQREARKLLAHAKYALDFLPEWMTMMGPITDPTLDVIRFSNHSTIESMPSADNPARGSTAFLLVVDEIAFLPNSDDAWAAIEPAFDVGGNVIVLSTARGEGNLFHKLWVASQTKAGDMGSQFHGIFFSWRAGDRDDAWFAKKCEELPEHQRAQEYPDNPEEAFLKSGRPVFDLERLRAMEQRVISEVDEPERGRIDQKADGSFVFVADGGELAVWEHPTEGGVYVLGADIAMGMEHGDYSCAHVIDARTKRVVAEWWGSIHPDPFGDYVLYNLGRYYNYALAGPESNNHGLTTITALRKAGYRNVYRQRHLNSKSSKPNEQYGWNTNRASKPLIIDRLSDAIIKDEIFIPSIGTLAELRTFVREGDNKMHGSPHDDRVMSLAIANQMLEYVWLQQYRNVGPTPGPGTVGYLLKKLFSDDEKRPSEQPIGHRNAA